jgi:hypothetical protein
MAIIGCKDFASYLEAWMEGERPSDAQAHLRGCPHCRTIVEDLDAIHATALDWNSEQAELPSHIWNSLRVQLEQEGLIRVRRLGWLGRIRGAFAPLPRPALAGAYLAALIIAAFALSGPVQRQVNHYRWIQGTQESSASLGTQLNSVEQATVSSMAGANPVVTASLHQNLAIVDNYISLCEKSVNEEPENEMARDYLFAAYQQKADLLAQMSERGE